jgi:hypothetical protein
MRDGEDFHERRSRRTCRAGLVLPLPFPELPREPWDLDKTIQCAPSAAQLARVPPDPVSADVHSVAIVVTGRANFFDQFGSGANLVTGNLLGQ